MFLPSRTRLGYDPRRPAYPGVTTSSRDATVNSEQLEKMNHGRGFVAALDQSGGSTPKALAEYGVPETAYSGDEEMFAVVHQMRSRIIRSPSFGGDRVLAAILFQNTLERQIEGRGTAAYLWEVKQIVPILKID